MNPLFVTSFGPEMYRATGVHLLRSFVEVQCDGALLVCTEGLTGEVREEAGRVLVYDLAESALLREWLASNRDIIPPSLGGTAPQCHCPQPGNPHVKHARGCPWGWFNKSASRWFRKIVSIEYARHLAGYDALIWLDSDCVIVQRIPSEEMERWFGSASAFYLKSPDREVVESGVIGFRLNEGGQRLLEDVVEHYRSGAFRADARWDDGYQFQLAMERNPEVRCLDLATRASGDGHVVAHSAVGRYVRHWKGVHCHVLRITG